MNVIIGLLTVVLVLDCAFLVLLVLLQLPKKEAGMGTAFGGGATDVLFGAGTGNVLTKATGWSAGIFLGLCLLLTIMHNKTVQRGPSSIIKDKLSAPAGQTGLPGMTPGAPATAPAGMPAPQLPAGDTAAPPISESPTVPADATAPPISESPTAPPLSESPTAPGFSAPPISESPTVPDLSSPPLGESPVIPPPAPKK